MDTLTEIKEQGINKIQEKNLVKAIGKTLVRCLEKYRVDHITVTFYGPKGEPVFSGPGDRCPGCGEWNGGFHHPDCKEIRDE